jgi:tetratricopeptide (TPR) repeat protein
MLLGDLQGASTALSLYASTTLSDPEAMVLLADCAMASGDRAKARQWLQWGIQRSPEHASAHALLGTLEGMEGRQKEANECFARAAKLDAGVAVKRCENGEILARVGQHQRALWEYVAALSIDPGHSPAYLGLGASFAAMGEGERAVESYLYYLRFDVTSPLADQARREIERLSSKPSGQ